MAKIQTQIKEKESGARLMVFIIPAVFIIVFIFAAVKKVKIYDEFSAGVGEAVKFTISLIPCLAAIFMMCELFEIGRAHV